MIRKNRILSNIDYSVGRGLELGPLSAPVLLKEEANVYYVDHLSREGLIDKYKNEPVKPSDIVGVDYVIGGADKLSSVVGNKKFDYVVASHVIEHVPDMITWLLDIDSILKPGGILSLAIPDKRYTFDVNRRNSSLSEVIGAHLDSLKKPSSAMMYDYTTKIVSNVDSGEAWDGIKDYSTQKRMWSRKKAMKMCIDNLKPDIYVDCHCYVFTPSSFIEIMRELTRYNYLDYELANFLVTQKGELEFYVSLRKPRRSDPKHNRIKSYEIELENDRPLFSKDEAILKGENESLKIELHNLLNSKSWKITNYFRKINSLIK